jgi:ABC-type transport system involved in multi-copper enzyme maturation permease subunit
MKNIFLIAQNTFRESSRDHILSGVLMFSVLFMFFVLALSTASLGEDARVFKSIGLGGIYLFGMLVTIFLASSSVAKEADRKTLYFILSRPVSRRTVIMGKFFGLLASIILSIGILSLAYFIALYIKTKSFDSLSLLSVFLQLFECGLMVSIVIFLSTFLRPILSIIASVVILYTGHSLTLLEQMTAKNGPVLKHGAEVLSYILPNLEKFNIREAVVYHFPISAEEITVVVLYGVVGMIFFLFAAGIIFEGREM